MGATPIDTTRRPAHGGIGWMQLASAVAEVLPPEDIHEIWLFPAVRREEREWGVAVVSRHVDAERICLFTASYMMIVRGRDRGQGRVMVEEVGEGPAGIIHEVLRGVQERSGEVEPPVRVSPGEWYPSDVEDARG